ncbi:hypothetical protein [Biostraticola tofi]|nr:hypothetical protein [Biostraticola tofi]
MQVIAQHCLRAVNTADEVPVKQAALSLAKRKRVSGLKLIIPAANLLLTHEPSFGANDYSYDRSPALGTVDPFNPSANLGCCSLQHNARSLAAAKSMSPVKAEAAPHLSAIAALPVTHAYNYTPPTEHDLSFDKIS